MGPTDVNAVTWAIFPGQEIVQSTIIDDVSFVSWKVRSTFLSFFSNLQLTLLPLVSLVASYRRKLSRSGKTGPTSTLPTPLLGRFCRSWETSSGWFRSCITITRIPTDWEGSCWESSRRRSLFSIYQPLFFFGTLSVKRRGNERVTDSTKEKGSDPHSLSFLAERNVEKPNKMMIVKMQCK